MYVNYLLLLTLESAKLMYVLFFYIFHIESPYTVV